MTPREAKLSNAATAIRSAARQVDMDWPQSILDDPMTTRARAELFRIKRREIAELNMGAAIVEAMLLNADGFAVLIELAGKKPMEFAAIVVLAQVELDRKPAEPEKAAA